MSRPILILSSEQHDEGIALRWAGRALLRGLEERAIRAHVHDPRGASTPDLGRFGAVLTWSYIVHRSAAFVAGARRLEERAREHGLPVINSIEGCGAPHSYFLETWGEHGVPCARCQRFERLEEIELGYPLLLRRDGVHQARDLFRVSSFAEAREIVEDRRHAGLEKLDLAIEFIEVRNEHGFFNKFRSLVVGKRVIPAHVFISQSWLVNYGHRIVNAASEAFGRDFLDRGEPQPEAVLAAARLTGSDVLALDYARRADGSYVFWEANRHFLFLEDYGDAMADEAARAGGLGSRSVVFEALGEALADLLLQSLR